MENNKINILDILNQNVECIRRDKNLKTLLKDYYDIEHLYLEDYIYNNIVICDD